MPRCSIAAIADQSALDIDVEAPGNLSGSRRIKRRLGRGAGARRDKGAVELPGAGHPSRAGVAENSDASRTVAGRQRHAGDRHHLAIVSTAGVPETNL
jgi:hypothetical protein